VIVARAPTRLDFGGGWTDVPPYADDPGGYVCNVTIARHATVRLGDAAEAGAAAERPPLCEAALRRAALPALPVALRSDFPVGAGLGGSSAAGVALAAALARWCGERADPTALAEWSRAVEVEELGIAGGRQDHYAAALGGALGLRFGGGRVEARRLAVSDATISELERRCIVAYTGEARVSALTITGVLDAYARREPRVCDALARMARLAEEMAAALEGGDVDALGTLVGEHWRWQRSLHPAIPTAAIDALLAGAADAGALGGKALGASGGGCVLVVAPAGRVAEVRAAVAAHGTPVDFTIEREGVRAWEESSVSSVKDAVA
jgi:D-glycero-alpha-D-manno-heptose-7-phosphate kinase